MGISPTEVNSVSHLPHALQKTQRDYGDDEHRAPWEAPLGFTIIPFQPPQHHCWLEPPGQHLWSRLHQLPTPGPGEALEQTGHCMAAAHGCSPGAVTAAKWHCELGHGHCPHSPRTCPHPTSWVQSPGNQATRAGTCEPPHSSKGLGNGLDVKGFCKH